jgi:pimeloyl-ACP methyl ester carboxylesterase
VGSGVQEAGYKTESYEADGGRVNVFRAGAGAPLLYLHPAGGAGIWYPYHDLLAERFEVFAPDHPGFGLSDTLPWTEAIDDYVYHYLAFLDRYEMERVDVVGASLGGWMAAELAVHHPERIRRLVLLSPIGLRIPGHSVADLFGMTRDELVAALFHDRAIGEAAFPADVDLDVIMQIFKENTAFARIAWNPFCANPKLERRLDRITSPTLVLWGDDDRTVPIEHGRRYAERIPNAELKVIPESGHAMLSEQPEAVVNEIVAFLGQPD